MVLQLTLKKKWFDMIASGEKTEEYREIKPFWRARLIGSHISPKKFDSVKFRNGYRSDSPTVTVECRGIYEGDGNVKWGAPKSQRVYIIKLGKVITAGQKHNEEAR